MNFYGPTFPNEAHYETLLSARQRFGNRSANMFFVRPARHVACPKRLKYMHDISTGYITYVEDSMSLNQPSNKYIFNKTSEDDMHKNNGFGFYNSAEAWREQLMELAQQVKFSLAPHEDPERCNRSPRAALLNRYAHKRSSSSLSNCTIEETDEQKVSKRLLNRRVSSRHSPSKRSKSKVNEKTEQEQSASNDENQDSGIWLIPILCYVLQIDNIGEAQDWLLNANPTEKRLAMELISRTMQDMQHNEIDQITEVSTAEQSSTAANMNNVYWPYKVLQRQEKERHQQQQIQTFLKQSKLTAPPSLPSLNVDNSDTCERATSPLRMVTPVKRSSATPTPHNFTAGEQVVPERSLTRHNSDRVTPTIIQQENPIQMSDRPTKTKSRPPSRNRSLVLPNVNDRPSRRSYRVATSMQQSTDVNTGATSSVLRGKTPLI